MNRLKTGLRVGGTLVAAIGIICLPIGFGVNPKRDLSAFSNFADLGAFVHVGLLLLTVGLAAVGLSNLGE